MASFKSVLANELEKPLCNYLLEQLKQGLEIRRAQIKEQEKFSGETNLTLTQAIFNKTILDDAEIASFSDLDYAVFFSLHMIHSLTNQKTFVLNRSNPAYMKIYYKIFENIFTLELKDEAEEPITSAEALTEVHLGWLKKLKSSSWQWRAFVTYVQISRSKAHIEELKNELVEQYKLKKFSKDHGKYWVYVINYHQLHDSIDMLQLCLKLAEEAELILALIGKKTTWKSENLTEFKRELITKMIEGKSKEGLKNADTICSKLDLPLDDFPILVSNKIRSSATYFCHRTERKAADPEHMPLNRVEELMHGCPEQLIHLVVFLYDKGGDHKMYAKGVYVRNNLTQKDFQDYPLDSKKFAGVAKDLEAMKYVKAKDFKPIEDLFEPVSRPFRGYQRLPSDVEVMFVQ